MYWWAVISSTKDEWGSSVVDNAASNAARTAWKVGPGRRAAWEIVKRRVWRVRAVSVSSPRAWSGVLLLGSAESRSFCSRREVMESRCSRTGSCREKVDWKDQAKRVRRMVFWGERESRDWSWARRVAGR